MQATLLAIVQYAPMPLFAILGMYQLTVPNSVCTAGPHWDMMAIMWFLMSLAHSQPYIRLLKLWNLHYA